MPKLSSLEAQLTEITREFVARIVETIRKASFSDVAGYAGETRPVQRPRTRPPAAKREAPSPPARRGRKPRQTVEKRAELGERILAILTSAGGPLGVRAIASEAGTAADLLATPLRELRQGGKIRKHGEKRNTTYSAV
jgi:chemotaxis response regulator CheB